MELAAAFRAEVPAELGGNEDEPALEARLGALAARGRAVHPDLAVDDVAFARHLGRCWASAGGEANVPLEERAIEDLFLACACTLGVPGAVERFEERCGARVRAVLVAATKVPELRGEIEQRVRALLLVGDGAEPPRIGTYGGQGSLDRWAAVVAQRQVIALVRHEGSEQRARENAGLEAALAAAPEPEVAYAKQRYRAEFERAMRETLGALDEKSRMLLRMQLVGGVSVESIGKMYGVSQPTASRWLARAREQVSDDLTRRLREQLGASPDEMVSLARLVASQLDLSISRLLRPDEIDR